MKASVPISLKMIFISMLCAALGLGGITVMALDFFKSEARTKALSSNKDLAEVLAREVANEFKSDLEEMYLFAHTLNDTKSISSLLNSQEALVSFGAYDQNKYLEIFFTANQDSLGEFEISQKSLNSQLLPTVIKMAAQHSDSVTAINTGTLIKKPLMTLAFFKDGKLFRSEIRESNLLQFFIHKEGLGIYIVDEKGSILLSNGEKPVESGSLRSTKNIGYGLSVITDLDESVVLQPLEEMQYRALLIGIMALGLTFIFTYLFSGQFSGPLLRIYKGFEKISTGHFDFNPDVVTNDEIGTLSLAFRKMSSRLQDRERLKNTLVKFSKAEEVDKILSGETKLPTEKKTMTVLICELQSGIDGSLGAEETIKHMNALWSEVNRSINKYLGFIDKTNGSFVRAVWGALSQVNDEGSSALAAALEIRKAVKQINEKRGVVSLTPFKVGIGIHTGEVVAGNVGLEGRSEYTFIGEGPLYAGHVTAATRGMKSDILISDETFNLIKNKGYIFGPVLTLEFFNGLKVHQVVGRKTQNGITESELSRSEQETILTGSFQSQPSSPPVHGDIQIPNQVQPQPIPQTQIQTQVFNTTPSQVTVQQPMTGTQGGYRFDISAGTNSAIAFQNPASQPPPAPQLQPQPQYQTQTQVFAPIPVPSKARNRQYDLLVR